MLLEGRVRAGDGVGVEGFVHRDRLGGRVFRAGAGTLGDGDLDALQRLERRDRAVGTEDHRNPAIEQRPEGVGERGALLAQMADE